MLIVLITIDSHGDYCVMYGQVMDSLGVCPDFADSGNRENVLNKVY